MRWKEGAANEKRKTVSGETGSNKTLHSIAHLSSVMVYANRTFPFITINMNQ